MKPFKIDVPVLLIFMARPEQFSQVFEQVKIARPSKLFLYQDGPREDRPDDISNIAKCRDIAEDIDWECEVHRFYQEKNVGCDPSEYIAQTWMFEHVDRGIILEDDDVPSQSFFPFCKELLEKYKDDTRIHFIAGMNHKGIYDNNTNNSYFFTTSGSIWGWATWKRCIDLWDKDLSVLDDQHTLDLLENKLGKKIFEKIKTIWKNNRASGRIHYESVLGAAFRCNSQMGIIPMKNLISNVGIAADATHAASSLKQFPRKTRRLFFMKTYELDFPLQHPNCIVEDVKYRDFVHNSIGLKETYIQEKMKNLEKRFNRIFYR